MFTLLQLEDGDTKTAANEAKRAKREEEKGQAREEKRKAKGRFFLSFAAKFFTRETMNRSRTAT